MFYVALYLIAIVIANLTVAWFGPRMVVVNAFLFIGLDLTARDYLHEAWHGRGLLWKMTLLIGTGSAISYALNKDAAQIAIASFIVFACAAIADTIIYHLLKERIYLVKVNG